jgi:hypothetical protein
MFGEPPAWIVEQMQNAPPDLLETILKCRKASS